MRDQQPIEADAAKAPPRRAQRARGGMAILDEDLIWELHNEIHSTTLRESVDHDRMQGGRAKKSEGKDDDSKGKRGRPRKGIREKGKEDDASGKRRRFAPGALAETEISSSLLGGSLSAPGDEEDHGARTVWAVSVQAVEKGVTTWTYNKEGLVRSMFFFCFFL